MPAWAWSLAAVLIVALGLVAFTPGGGVRRALEPGGEYPVTIRLEEEKGQMNDLRFLDLTTELLRADRRYHQEMFQVLAQLGEPAVAREEPAPIAAASSDRGDFNPRGEILRDTDLSRFVN